MRMLLVGAMFLIVGCGNVRPTQMAPVSFDGTSSLGFAEEQMAFGPRVPGSGAIRQAGDRIASSLEEMGWQTADQTFAYRGVELRNIIAQRGGETGPRILLGAHYDSRKVADQDPGSAGEPVPGANDGASGVGVLLELARVLPTDPPECPVQLAFFDGEDSGGIDGWEWIVGSTYMAQNLTQMPAAMIVVDMVGDEDLDLYMEANSDRGLRESLWHTASSLGYSAFVPIVKYTMIDDHIPFIEKGIPSVDIIDFDYPYWHTRRDTLDKLSPASLEQVGRTLQTWLAGCPASLGS